MLKELLGNLDLLFICIGLPAQLIFFSRFLVQWIVSEKHGKSVMPVSFWYLSIGGSVGLFTYGILRGEPVLVIGQAIGSIVYIRNLILIAREKNAAIAVPPSVHPHDANPEDSENKTR